MKRKLAISIVIVAVLAALDTFAAHAEDANWPQFLGPGARAVSDNPNLADRWSATENVAWKTDIAGRAWSSPIVWGDRVFLTTVIDESGKAENVQKGFFPGGKPPAAPDAKCKWDVVCLDLTSGKVLWQRTAREGTPPGPTHAKNSYASETPATDGERVYAYFGNIGVYCYDLDGKLLWSKPTEPRKMKFGWGTAISPVVDDDRLYILNDNEDKSYLLALDKKTGEQAWRVDRDEKSNWSTPLVWKNDQRTEIVTVGSGKVRSYGVDGKPLWSLKWSTGRMGITVATPYADGGLLYVSSGFVREKEWPLYAIRPGGNGDVSLTPGKDATVAWFQPMAAPYIPTTVLYDHRLYVLYDHGTVSAFDSETGRPIYERQKLPGAKQFTSSPWAASGHLFCIDEDGVTHVVRAGDKFEVVCKNRLGDDDACLATPAIAGDRLLIRTAARVYCIRKNAGESK
jgi:outer membrane protein assembly factor BamB